MSGGQNIFVIYLFLFYFLLLVLIRIPEVMTEKKIVVLEVGKEIYVRNCLIFITGRDLEKKILFFPYYGIPYFI